MLYVHVAVHVRPGMEEAFLEATLANARESAREPGVARFDILREADAPERFALIEVYRTPEDAGRHKETAHYKTWRDVVAPMMAEPRASGKYVTLHPDDKGWDYP